MQPLGQGGGQGWWTGGRRKIAAAPAGEKGHFWEKMRARFLPRPILPLSRYTPCMHSPWGRKSTAPPLVDVGPD